MASSFWAKQISDVRPEHLASALMSLSTEGFTDWQILSQRDVTYIYPPDGDTPERRVGQVELFTILAWGQTNDEEE